MKRFVVVLGVVACARRGPAQQGPAPPAAPGPPVVEARPPVEDSPLADLCASLEAALVEREARRRADARACARLPQPERDHCMADPLGDPRCEVSPVTVAGLVAPWREVAVHCSMHDEIYGPKECAIVIDHDGSLLQGPGFSVGHRAADLTVDAATVQDVIAGGSPELVLRHTVTEYGEATEHVSVCRGRPAACSTPIPVGAAGWKVSVRFDKGSAVLERADGDPPATALGTKSLVFK